MGKRPSQRTGVAGMLSPVELELTQGKGSGMLATGPQRINLGKTMVPLSSQMMDVTYVYAFLPPMTQLNKNKTYTIVWLMTVINLLNFCRVFPMKEGKKQRKKIFEKLTTIQHLHEVFWQCPPTSWNL